MKLLKRKTSSGHTKLIKAENLQVGEYFMKAAAWQQTQDSQSRLRGKRATEVSIVNGIVSIRCSINGKKYHAYYAKSDNLVVVLPIGGKVLERKELKTKGRLMRLKKIY